MKKVLITVLALSLLLVGLVGCSNNQPANNGTTTPTTSTATDNTSGSNAPTAGNGNIDTAQAQNIALQDAGLTEASFVQSKLDYDDGRSQYDLKFVANGQKYEYEVSAENGRILEKSQQAVDTTKAQDGYIGSEAAQKAALDMAGLSADQAVFSQISLDREDGQVVYELEFFASGQEYDVEVAADTGTIAKFTSEAANN